MNYLELSFFGSFRVLQDGQPLYGFESDKVRALLAYLAVTMDQPHRREALAGLFWPDIPDQRARTNLRNVLANLRQVIGDHDASPHFLLITPQTLQFNRFSDHWLDVDRFTTLMKTGTVEQLEAAVALYQGAFLDGFSISDSPVFEEWALLQREHFNRQTLAALRRLARQYEQQGDCERALAHLWRHVELEPWDEEAQRQLIRLLALTDQRAAALAQYQVCQRALAQELGVEPDQETTQLYNQIRDGSLTTPAPATTVHRKGTLPTPTTPFVGRETELVDLAGLLDDPAVRLITILGVGGMGKTRLALEAATRHQASYADGAYYVPLVGFNEPASIIPAVAEAIGYQFYPGDTQRQQILDYLRGLSILLVLDNFEQLLAGVDLILAILQTAPGIKLLVTSRERLNLYSETLLRIEGFDVPSWKTPEDAMASNAARLFAQSARRVRPTFKITRDNLGDVARICQQVGGMPLGILLAAAWIDSLSLAEIAQEIERSLDFLESDLHDLPERQRSIRAVFESSWKRLTDVEQTTLRALSVFRGGFTREAAQQVAGASFKTLNWLVSTCLLSRDSYGRYEFHELMRQYAEELLRAFPEEYEQVRDNHAQYYASFLENRRGPIRTWQSKAVQDEIEVEWGNVYAAWQTMLAERLASLVHRSADTLWHFFEFRARYDDGAVLFRQAANALDVPQPDAETEIACGVVLFWQALLVADYGQLEEGMALNRQCLALLGKHGSPAEVSQAVSWLAVGHLMSGEFDLGKQVADEALAMAEAVADPYYRALPRWVRGLAALFLKNYAEARRLGEEAVRLAEEAQDLSWSGQAYSQVLAPSVLNLGEIGLAKDYYRRGIEHFEALGARWWAGYAITEAIDLYLAVGDYGEATRLYQRALQSSGGTKMYHAFETLFYAARVLAAQGHNERATEVLALVVTDPLTHKGYLVSAKAFLADVRAKMTDADFNAAFERGKALDFHAVVAQLLAEPVS